MSMNLEKSLSGDSFVLHCKKIVVNWRLLLGNTVQHRNGEMYLTKCIQITVGATVMLSYFIYFFFIKSYTQYKTDRMDRAV